MDWQPYIHSNPNILVGKPVVKGTRLAVEFPLGLYAAGWTEAQILESYPTLTPEALRAVHAFAARSVTLSQVREGGHSSPPIPGLKAGDLPQKEQPHVRPSAVPRPVVHGL